MSEKVERIGEYIEIEKFYPVITLSMIEDKEGMATHYVITDEIEQYISTFLNVASRVREPEYKTFRVVGLFGTGKSYFLLFNSFIVDSLRDKRLYNVVIKQLEQLEKGESHKILKKLKTEKKQFLSVRVPLQDYMSEPLYAILIEAIKRAIKIEIGETIPIAHEFEKIEEYLRSWETEKPEIYDNFIQELKNQKSSIGEFRGLLKNRDEKAKELFIMLTQRIVKVRPDVRPDYILLPDLMANITSYLTGKGFHGLILFLDELHQYLEARRDYVAMELRTLQSLAEMTKENPMVIIVSMLTEEQIAIPPSVKDEFKRIMDRFSPLKLTLRNVEDIIRSRVRWKCAEYILDTTLQKIGTKFKLFKEMVEKRYASARYYLRTYPFHPLTIAYLERISGLRSQQRSAFTFAVECGKQFLNKPIHEIGKPTLVNPDLLYDFFEDDIASYNKPLSDIIDEILAGTTKPSEKQVIKIWAVASALKERLLPKDLTFVFLEEVSDIFSAIRVRYPSYVGRSGDGFILRAITEKISADIDKIRDEIDPYQELVNLLEQSGGIRKIFIDKVQREVEVEFTLYKKLDTVLARKTSAEGRVIIILSDKKVDPKEIADNVRKIGEKDVLVFIKELNIPIEPVRDFFAIEKYMGVQKLRPEEEDRLKDWKASLNIPKLVEKLFSRDNFKIYIKGGLPLKTSAVSIISSIPPIVSEIALGEMLSPVLRGTYAEFYGLRIEQGIKRTFTNRIIKEFISEQGRGKKRDALDKYISKIAIPLGLAIDAGDRYRLAIPGKKDPGGKIIDKILSVIGTKEIDLSEIYDTLSRPPYGLVDELIELYVFSLMFTGKILVNKRGVLIRLKEVSYKEAEAMSKYPSLHTVKKGEVIEAPIWPVISSVWSELGKPPSEYTKKSYIPSTMVADVWQEFRSEIEETTVTLEQIDNKLKEYIGSIHDEIASVINGLTSLKPLPTDPYEGFRIVYERILQMTCETDPHEAFHKFKEKWNVIKKYEEFVKKAVDDLMKKTTYLTNCTPPERYEKLINEHKDLIKFSEENKVKFITDEIKRDAFIETFGKFKHSYILVYLEEHDQRNALYSELYKGIEGSMPWVLLEELEDLKVPLEETIGTLSRRINRTREINVCDKDVQKMLDTDVRCVCGFCIGTLEKCKKEAQSEESSLKAESKYHAVLGLERLNYKLSEFLETPLGRLDKKFLNFIEDFKNLRDGINELIENYNRTKEVEEVNAKEILEGIKRTKSVLKEIVKMKPVKGLEKIPFSTLVKKVRERYGSTIKGRDLLRGLNEELTGKEDALVSIDE